MLPYRDHNRTEGVPVITIAFLVINVLVWLFQVMLQAGGQLEPFIYTWSVIPAQLVSNPFGEWLTVFSAMFMHGSWMHIIGNMLYLWIFGDNIEDALGIPLYIVFYFASGIVATVAQVAVNPGGMIPNLGASGAIAGVLGAYLITYPKARVDTIVTLGYFWRRVQLPAVAVLGFWIVIQLFSGVGSLSVQTSQGGVAYFAHIGGFVAGVAMMGLWRLLGGDPHRHRKVQW